LKERESILVDGWGNLLLKSNWKWGNG